MIRIAKVTCAECNHTWAPRVPNPRQCPNCWTYNWRVDARRPKGKTHPWRQYKESK